MNGTKKSYKLGIVILQRGSEILKESKSDRLRETAQSALQERTPSVNPSNPQPATLSTGRDGLLKRY